MGFSDRYGLYCGLESDQAVTSSVRERQERRKEWESGGQSFSTQHLSWEKNSHFHQGKEVMSIRKSVRVVISIASCKVRAMQGEACGVVAGRNKHQATGRNWATGVSSGAGSSPRDRGAWKGLWAALGEGAVREFKLWRQFHSPSSLTTSPA